MFLLSATFCLLILSFDLALAQTRDAPVKPSAEESGLRKMEDIFGHHRVPDGTMRPPRKRLHRNRFIIDPTPDMVPDEEEQKPRIRINKPQG